MRHWPALLLGFLFLLVSPIDAAAQEEPPQEVRPSSNPVESRPRPEPPRWPRLTPAQQDLAEINLKRLAHKDPERAMLAAETLKALGPGVAPLVLNRLSDAQPQLNEVLESIAAAVVACEHGPVLCGHLKHHLRAPRAATARLLALVQARQALPELKAALEQEKEPEVRETMALALCRLGDLDGLPTLNALALQAFLERRPEILAAAQALKGPEATAWLLERLKNGAPQEKLAALRLLAVAGTSAAVPPVSTYLEHDNHTLKTEAINVLRAIVDGRPPLKHISVFDMIRLRQEWQARLPGLLKER